MAKLLTEEQYRFFRANAYGISTQELTDLVNKEFRLNLQPSQVKSYKTNHKIQSGMTGKFEKGHVPVNKGKKYPGKRNKTSFKKGQAPSNKMNIGSERVNSDGYIDIKIADPNTWKAKHRIIYEEAYGPVPEDHAVIFADGDRRNVDINNLVMISRKKLLVMNQNNLIKDEVELTKTGMIIADIKIKTVELLKDRK